MTKNIKISHQILAIFVIYFIINYCGAQTPFDVDNPPPDPFELPTPGDADDLDNINYRDAVDFQDLKKAVCHVHYLDIGREYRTTSGFLVNSVNNSFVTDHNGNMRRKIYLLVKNDEFDEEDTSLSDTDSAYLSFDYEVAHAIYKNEDDINNESDATEYNAIRRLWKINFDLQILNTDEEAPAPDHTNLALYSIFPVDDNGGRLAIEDSEVFQHVYVSGWTLHPKPISDRIFAVGHPEDDIKKFMSDPGNFSFVPTFVDNIDHLPGSPDYEYAPNYTLDYTYYKHIIFNDDNFRKTRGAPLFYDKYAFGMLSDYDRTNNDEVVGLMIENFWKDYRGLGKRPLTFFLDPANTWISKVEGGYLRDLLPNELTSSNLELKVSSQTLTSREFEIPTKDFFPVNPVGRLRENFLGHGILGNDLPNETYLTIRPADPQFNDLILYGTYLYDGISAQELDQTQIILNQRFKGGGWNVNTGVPNVINPIPELRRYGNINSRDFRNLIFQYLRITSSVNEIISVVSGSSNRNIRAIAEIKNLANISTVKAFKLPYQMPYNTVEMFHPGRFIGKMWQSIKYHEHRGRESEYLHIKSMTISHKGVSKTIRTGDNGGYLNLVSPNYKPSPIKTSIKEAVAEAGADIKYNDISANLVTITLDIHNPGNLPIEYGAWIDYFNTKDLWGVSDNSGVDGITDFRYRFVTDSPNPAFDQNNPDPNINSGGPHHIENVKVPYPDGHPNRNDFNNFVENPDNSRTKVSFTFKMPSAEEIKLVTGGKRTTRLRIGIYHKVPDFTVDPHQIFQTGEVEDYLIEIQAPTEQEIAEAIAATAMLDIRAPKRRRIGEPDDNSYTGSAGDHFQQFSNSNSNTPTNNGPPSFSEQAALLMQYPIGVNLTDLTKANLITSNFENWGQAGDEVFCALLQKVRNVFNQFYAFLPNDLINNPPSDLKSTIKFEDLKLINFTNPKNPFRPDNDDINNGNPANDENPLGIDDLFPLDPIPSGMANPFEGQNIDDILKNGNNKVLFWQIYNNIVRFALRFYDPNGTLDQKFLNSLGSNAADDYWWAHNFFVNELQQFQNDQANFQRAEKIVDLFEDLVENPQNALRVKFIFSKISILFFEYALTVPIEFLPSFIAQNEVIMIFLLRDYLIPYFIAMRNMSWLISQGPETINFVKSGIRIAIDMTGEWIPQEYEERIIGSELWLKGYPKTEFDLAVIYHAKGSNNEVILGIDHEGLLEYHVRLGEVQPNGTAYWQTVYTKDHNDKIPLGEIVTVKVQFKKGIVSLFLNEKKVGSQELETQSGATVQKIDGYLNFTDQNYGARWGGPVTNFDGVETYPNGPNLVDLDGLFYRFLGLGFALPDDLLGSLILDNAIPTSRGVVNAEQPKTNATANAVIATQETAKEEATPDFSIFPNPAKNKLNILVEIQQAGTLSVNIFDLAGKQVYEMQESEISKGHQLITLRNLKLSAGQYIVKVKAGNVSQSEQVVFE